MQETSQIAGGNMVAPTSPGKYILQGFFRITDQHAALFMLKKIKRIDLHNAFRLVSPREAQNVMGYVRCLK